MITDRLTLNLIPFVDILKLRSLILKLFQIVHVDYFQLVAVQYSTFLNKNRELVV